MYVLIYIFRLQWFALFVSTRLFDALIFQKINKDAVFGVDMHIFHLHLRFLLLKRR